jgi:ligand-binding SRPBCC domain-containing protein
VDEQIRGPYKYWHHHHVIEPVDNGVLFTDHVEYKPPFGPIGQIANGLFIKGKLDEIFSFRARRLNELLG